MVVLECISKFDVDFGIVIGHVFGIKPNGLSFDIWNINIQNQNQIMNFDYF